MIARCEESGEIAGIACRSTRRVFINGSERRIGYLGQLRIDARYRGRWLVSRGFRQLKQWHDCDPLPGYLAAIVEDNREATGILTRKPRPGFPRFVPTANYATLAIPLDRRIPNMTTGNAEMTWAREENLPDIAAFLQSHGRRRQFHAVWTEHDLRHLAAFGLGASGILLARRDGRIVGSAALWDQSAFKQTVVRGYSGWLRPIAAASQWGAPLLGRKPLPRPGEHLRGVYAALVCVAGDDALVFEQLLHRLFAAAQARGHRYLLVGLDVRDPLLPIARAFSHILYSSRLYLAAWPDGEPLYEPDPRPAYVDIATL